MKRFISKHPSLANMTKRFATLSQASHLNTHATAAAAVAAAATAALTTTDSHAYH